MLLQLDSSYLSMTTAGVWFAIVKARLVSEALSAVLDGLEVKESDCDRKLRVD